MARPEPSARRAGAEPARRGAESTAGAPGAPRRRLLVLLAAGALAFLGSLWLHRSSALHDTDSYFHLAIARLYAQEGVVDELPALRFSLLGPPGFGDKELGFHLLLAPLAGTLDPLVAGRLGLSLLAALLTLAVGGAAMRSVGSWGALLPFWIAFASTETTWRLVRLRPELLSLLLLLLAARAMISGRPRWLGLVAFLYTLSYTAFQALLGLVALGVAVLATGRGEGGARREGRLLLYAVLGVGAALVAHPHFPANLEVWLAQNVQFFLAKESLDVGTEIRPHTTDVTLMVNLGWILGLAVLAGAARPVGDERPPEQRRAASVYGLFALVFGVLYLLMSRFSLYFFPFASLWWLARLRARGRRIGSRVLLPGGRSVPLALAALAVLAIGLPEATRQLRLYHHRTSMGPADERIADREAFSAALEPGARVAADWGPTATYLLWAPQARYLNALDPLFMAGPHPAAHRALEEILSGDAPDVPMLATVALDSDHLAWPWHVHQELRRRLEGDPRVETLHRGLHHLVRWRGAPGFVLDWRVAPPLSRAASGRPPIAPEVEIGDWPAVPRPPDPALRGLEAYVDAERLLPEARCVGFARDLRVDEGASRDVELAPWGPTAVWLGNREVLSVGGDLEARIGQGIRAELSLDPARGSERLLVVTCEGRRKHRKGFSWRERVVASGPPDGAP